MVEGLLARVLRWFNWEMMEEMLLFIVCLK